MEKLFLSISSETAGLIITIISIGYIMKDSNTPKKEMKIQKAIKRELAALVQTDPNSVFDSMHDEWLDHEMSQLDAIMFNIVGLRLRQLNIDPTDDETDQLLEMLDLYSYVEAKTSMPFKKIAKIPKSTLLKALGRK